VVEPSSIRASSLNGYRELVASLGGDAEELLHQATIDPTLIENESASYPLRSFIELLELTARHLKCPDFGLRLAEVHGNSHLGALGIVGANSSTVGTAMHEILKHLNFHSPAIIANLDTQMFVGKCTFTWDFSVRGVTRRIQIDESAVGNIYQELKLLADGHCIPEMVLFRHSATKPLPLYRKYFKSPVLFGQEINGVVVKPEFLNKRLFHVNPQLQKLALTFVRESLAKEPANIGVQVRQVVLHLLRTNQVGIDHVADKMGLHARTLQRRLNGIGLTFDSILDSVRQTRASELLTHSNLSMLAIANHLGYSEQATFTRACRRWFGSPPASVRRRAYCAA
jgi:AraC-like DNA-binding protein